MARAGLGLLSVAWLASGCIFPLPNPATPGAITFQQAKTGHTNSPQLFMAFNDLNTNGNAIVVGMVWQPATAPPPTIIDTGRNTYTAALPPVNGSGTAGNEASQIAYATNITAGQGFPLALTVTKQDLTSLDVIAVEYAGVSSTSPIDGTAATSADVGPDMNASITTTSVRDLLVGWAVSGGQADAGPGFLTRDAISGDIIEDEVAPIAGTYSASATATTPDWIFVVSAFRAAP